jgi:hypothetical protein
MTGRANLTLGRLAELSSEELKSEWARRFGAPVPTLSPELLRLGIGYELQAQRYGGPSRSTRSVLRHAMIPVEEGRASPPRKLTPGTKLVRDWHGAGHTVTVLADGFDYDGRHWRSLTAIAKAITGVKWNGPRFFGLSERRK